MTDAGHPKLSGWRHVRRAGWVLIGLFVLLVIVRLIMPYAVKRYVNHQLNTSRDYSGSVDDIHIQLYKGQYRIETIKITKRDGKVSTPLFSADRMDLAVEWKELFHGSIVCKIKVLHPEVNFVSGPTAEQSQSGTNENWGQMLSSLVPFDINRFEVTNGQIHFKNEYSTPKVDVYIKDLGVIATNLNNARTVGSALPAGIKAHADTLGNGGFDLNVQLNPVAAEPTYQLVAQLTNVDLPALNNFIKAYGKFDVERGRFALYSSVASKDGNYDGYVKVFFDNMKVFAWEKEKKKDALGIFWDAVVGGVTTLLKNQPKDSLATRVPISGSYSNSPSIGTWTAISSLLGNAFVHALAPKVDEKKTVETVAQKTERKKEMKNSPFVSHGSQKLAGPSGN